MKTKFDPVAEKIAQVDARLEVLEFRVKQIGRPAANRLFERLEALRVEDRALQRNFEENQTAHDEHRLEQLDTLLHHIECEEASLEHEAAFLAQSAPSAVTTAAETGARAVAALGKGIHKILHGHHPLGCSVFVNHTHDNLVQYHGLEGELDADRREP